MKKLKQNEVPSFRKTEDMKTKRYDFGDFSIFAQENQVFWKSMEDGFWEPGTLRFIRSRGTTEAVFVDVGAWIGPTTLVAAATGMKVYAFEPDPVAFSALRKNVALNPQLNEQISISNTAFYWKTGHTELHKMHALGDSQSSLLGPKNNSGIRVGTINGEEFLSNVQVPEGSIIKLDIEGGEYALVPKLVKVIVKKRLTCLLSTHPERFATLTQSTKVLPPKLYLSLNFWRNFVFFPLFFSHTWWEDLHHSTEIRRLGPLRLMKRVFSSKNHSFYLIPNL